MVFSVRWVPPLLLALQGVAAAEDAELPRTSAGDGLLPIFLMHGLGANASWFSDMQTWIAEIDPTATTYAFSIFQQDWSYSDLWVQVEDLILQIRLQVLEHPEVYAEGYALLCHSQGALLCRCAVELMNDHNVHTLISLAGPQQGVFGVPTNYNVYIPKPLFDAVAFSLLYSPLGQLISVSDFWHDPRTDFLFGLADPHASYLKHNSFLPVLNNDPNRTSQGPFGSKSNARAASWRSNILQLKRAVFTGSPADQTVVPWNSALWDFYAKGSTSVVKPLEELPLWVDDWLGLRTLNETGRLVRRAEPDVCHRCWVQNKTVFENIIAQYLPRRAKARKEAAPAASTSIVV